MYGAVIFDDDARPSAGWASVRGETAFRIRGMGDLASDVYWWTNMPSGTFIRYGGFRQTRLRKDDYLRPNMRQLHTEMGLLPVRMPAARIVEITAEVFDRVMRLAEIHHGLPRPHEPRLQDDLYPLVVKADESLGSLVDSALDQAHQPWVACTTAPPAKAGMISFRRPRINHVLDVLSTPVPADQWEYVEDRKMPPEGKRIDWLVSQSRPVLAKAVVKRVDHEVSQVICFGAGSMKQRSWMSHPELLMLSKFAQIRIEGAFLGSEYEEQHVYRPVFTGGPFGSLSVSAGILAENYLMALSEARVIKKMGQDRTKVFSPRAVWYTASASLYSLMPALMLHGSGFCVMGYGRGVVTLAIPKGALDDARQCAAAAGLQAPLHVGDDIAAVTALSS